MQDEKFQEFPLQGDENDDEIKEALKNFFQVVNNKAGREAQKRVEGLTDDQVRKAIVSGAVRCFGDGCTHTVNSMGALKVLSVPEEKIERLVRLHAEFQIELLRLFDMEGLEDFDTAVKVISEAESDAIEMFVKQHSDGAHPGCVIDEYRKRNEWPEEVEEVENGFEQ